MAPLIRISPHLKQSGQFVLETEILLPESRETVFEFFADAHRLETLTPPWLHFQVLTPPPIPMQAGQWIDYKLRLYGLPIRWRSEISVWEPPVRFVDEQVRGPYKKWHHEHTFEEYPEGTLVRDRVEYAVPGGRWVNRLFVAGRLKEIFRFRQQTLSEIFPVKSEDDLPAGG